MADIDLSGVSTHKLNKFTREYLMAEITKCANWQGCSKAETCARCPSENEKKYFFGASFHPEAPWLCFCKREAERIENDKAETE